MDTGTIDLITQYIVAIGPAVTALIGVIVTIAVGVGAVKKAISGSDEKIERISKKDREIINKLEQANNELMKANREVRAENKEIKQTLMELNRKIDIIDTIKAVRKE